MNAILLSINPRWCDLILSGQKNVEVRKRIPQRFGAPFRVYLYRTRKSGSAEWDGMIVGEFICDKVYGLERDEYVYIDLNGWKYDKWIWVDGSERFDQLDRRDLRTCLSGNEMTKYAKNSDKLYGLHVSEVKRYETPVTIEELTRCRHLDRERVCGRFMQPVTVPRTGSISLTRFNCPYQHVDYFNPNYRPNECECRRKVNTNAPQSWQYVDDDDAQAAVERMNPIRVETP